MPTDYYAGQLIEGALVAGRYRLMRWLGLGAMGEVWAARDERLGRDVAVKLLRPNTVATGEERADRFVREAIAAARINHPNVVAVYDQGEYHRHLFVVMELITGSSLDDLRLDGPMPVGSALAIATQICFALEAAHAAGVVHRDIKPANVMVTTDGRVKVLDFGIAGFMRSTTIIDKITRHTGIMGTPAYMAPEQVLGQQADARSDLYSLGCVLYALLTGAPPFDTGSSLDIMDHHVHKTPEPMSRRRFGIPPEIDQLVLWLLAKDPARRPKTAAVVAGRLEHLAASYARSVPPMAPAALPASAGPVTVTMAAQPPNAGHVTMVDMPAVPAPRRRWPSRIAATLLVVGIVGALLAVGRMTMNPQRTATRSTGDGVTTSVTHHTTPSPTATTPQQAALPVSAPGTAPMAPFFRYGAVASGNGCSQTGQGQYDCVADNSKVYQTGTLTVIGTIAAGDHTFFCQSSGHGQLTHHGFSNNWWAWTESDQGTWGWVNAIDLAGGDNNQPEPGLPNC
jgi:eukaryotic-like serine/threonine-protein kinase